MRKVLSLLLVVILLIPCGTHAEATKTRGLVSFLELYTLRFANYANKNGIKFDASIYSDIPPSKKGDYLLFESSAGLIGVYPASYAIHDLNMTLLSGTANDTRGMVLYTSCIMAFSALEFDASYDMDYSFAKRSVTDDVLELFHEKIWDKMEELLPKAVQTGERVFICSCNYDYYIEYYAPDDSENHWYVYLIAEERK